MSGPSQPCDPPTGGVSWGQALWPQPSTADSPLLRRRKLSVRSGHLGMVILVAVAVAGPLIFGSPAQSTPANVALVLLALAYVAWNLAGTHGLVRLVLSEGPELARSQDRQPAFGAVVYFTVQLALAAGVYVLGDRGRLPNLVWLALLPPVAYSVFYLHWRGIAGVTLASMGILLAGVVRWHGASGLAYSGPAFAVALTFTLVFTLLAVNAETARHQAQSLTRELQSANEQLRRQAVEREELAVAHERNRLAREIHDSLGHHLTVIHLQIEAARALETAHPERARDALAKAGALARSGLQEIRESVAALRASPLENRRLADAIRDVIEQHRAAGLDCTFHAAGAERPVSPAAALTLYRAAQEGLTNVQKHARARRAAVTLDFRDPARLRLQVADDGPGSIDPGSAPTPAGFGLPGLQERVQLLGGRLHASRAATGGWLLDVEVPA